MSNTIELKIARGAASLYRLVLNLSIGLSNRRDRKNHKRFHAAHRKADTNRILAAKLEDEATRIEIEANDTLDTQNKQVVGTYNALKAARDGLTLRI